MAIEGEDYRNTALAVIKKADGKILILFNKRINSIDPKNVDKETYKFPQGGIDEGENPDEAVLREVKEELGISFRSFDIKRFLHDYVSYWFRNSEKLDYEIRLYAFLFEVEDLDEESLVLDPLEASELKWVNPREVDQLELGIRHDAYLSILRRFDLI